jgi:translation initiation factor IF-2
MENIKSIRLSQLAKNLNINSDSIIFLLKEEGFELENNPNVKVSEELISILEKKVNKKDKQIKTKDSSVKDNNDEKKNNSKIELEKKEEKNFFDKNMFIKKVGFFSGEKKKIIEHSFENNNFLKKKIDKDQEIRNYTKKEVKKIEEIRKEDFTKKNLKENIVNKSVNKSNNFTGIKILGSLNDINSSKEISYVGKNLAKEKDFEFLSKSNKNTKINLDKKDNISASTKNFTFSESPRNINEKNFTKKREKNDLKFINFDFSEKKNLKPQPKLKKIKDEIHKENIKKVKISEFASPSDISSLINVKVPEIIKKCFEIGIVVSINQRLEKEAIEIVLNEFGFQADFINIFEDIDNFFDENEKLVNRSPIVTIMGHVDHGKTSLLDYIQKQNKAKEEIGGITQNIKTYITNQNGRDIIFLDTPGHESFTAMRARGSKITDIIVIVIAADDGVMIQTKEAINHAKACNNPIVIAITKIDKTKNNIDKIKQDLAQEGILVEDWGGKVQVQLLSSKTGEGVNELLEKILFEAEILDLKCNQNRPAIGTVIESFMQKGVGYVANVIVQKGTLKIGDFITIGSFYGKIKVINDLLGKKVKEAKAVCPVEITGIEGGIPSSGDTFKVVSSEQEAKEISSKRQFHLKEHSNKVKKLISLEEVNRRIAVGDFQEIRIILKASTAGILEALSDSLIKLSTEKFLVNIISKSIGSVLETDLSSAEASKAIIICFQIKVSSSIKDIAEKKGIKINSYSIIYDAIDQTKLLMESMLKNTIKRNIVGRAKILEIFKISKVGMIAGSLVESGIIKRVSKVSLTRDGKVIYEGKIDQLKREKNDTKEVKEGIECGIFLNNFSGIKKGDIIEAYEEIEIKNKL